MNQAGEAHTCADNSVWVTRTHYPWDSPYGDTEFDVDKVFVTTRNPIDAFCLLFLFWNTASHSMTSQENFSKAFPEQWDFFIKEFV